MRYAALGLALTVGVIIAMPAQAQYNGRDALRMQNLQGNFQDPGLRRSPRNWQEYRNFDFDRLEPGQSKYWADRYYRPGQSYRRQVLDADDRVYGGRDGRFYCRRSDGTTGLIVGGLNDDALPAGESQTVGALDRAAISGRVVCR